MVTLAISALLLAALVGGLLWSEASRGDSPVKVSLQAHEADAYRHDGLWYVPVTVTNDGDVAAELLQVELGSRDETADVEWEFVGGGQSVDATATFEQRPQPGDVELGTVTATAP